MAVSNSGGGGTTPTTTGSGAPKQWWQYAQDYLQRRNPFGSVRGTAGLGLNTRLNPDVVALQQGAQFEQNLRRLDEARGTGTFQAGGNTIVRTPEGAAPGSFSPNSAFTPPITAPQNVPALQPWWARGEKPEMRRDIPARTPAPTSTFLAGGGETARVTENRGTSTRTPTGSVIAGGGDYVMGPNGLPYYVGPQGPNTFIAAGGEAVRGPDMSYFLPPEAPLTTPGFGTSYDWWRRRGGGGGGGWGGGRSNLLLGLNQWNYGE